MPQSIESYLVSLGFEVKQPELAKFRGALDDAGKFVEKNTSGIVKDFAKLQFAITSAFLAVGIGAIAMVDKVAMADQSYRLMGEKMFMSKDAARSFDTALKALGATMDEVAWDPELNKRFNDLLELQDRLAAKIGPDFDGNMMKIRDLREEYSKFTIEMQYLSYSVVNDLFNRLGLGSGDLLSKIQKFNDYIVDHLPEITKTINDVLAPALERIWHALQMTWQIGEKAFLIFERIISLFTGDTSLDKTQVTFEGIAKSVEHVFNFVDKLLTAILDLEDALLNLDFSKLTGTDAKFLGGAAGASLLGSAAAGAGAKGILGWLGSALGIGASGAEGAAIASAGAEAGTGVGIPLALGTAGLVGAYEVYKHWDSIKGAASGAGDAAGGAIERLTANANAISKMTGIDPKLVFGQLWHESAGGTNRGAQDLHNLSGIKNPGGNGYRNFEDDGAYDKFMAHLLLKDGLSSNVGNPEQYASILKRAHYYEDNEGTYAKGIRSGEGKYGGVTTGDININIAKTNATKEDIVQGVKEGLSQSQLISLVKMQANLGGSYQ